MNTKILHVVGDRFGNFCVNNDNVVTLSEFETMIVNNWTQADTTTLVVAGQGVDIAQLKRIEDQIKASKSDLKIMFSKLDKVDKRRVHKEKDQNVLISAPYKVTEHLYGASVLIDDRCAEMSDHVTGQHIQGMVILEAARQMFIGVTESFFIEESKRGRYYFIIRDFGINYESMAFPLPMVIQYFIDEGQIDQKGNWAFRAHMDFEQAGTIVSKCEVSFSAYETKYVTRIEAMKARQVLSTATLSAKARAEEHLLSRDHVRHPHEHDNIDLR